MPGHFIACSVQRICQTLKPRFRNFPAISLAVISSSSIVSTRDMLLLDTRRNSPIQMSKTPNLPAPSCALNQRRLRGPAWSCRDLGESHVERHVSFMCAAMADAVSAHSSPMALPTATFSRRSPPKIHGFPANTNAIAAQAHRTPNASVYGRMQMSVSIAVNTTSTRINDA